MKMPAKFGGATGNFNAHNVAFPNIDWIAFGNKFTAEKLGVEREAYTTQISNYDNLSRVFDSIKRINVIMIVSRLQRDLTDSTVLRNIGVPLAHSIISIKSIQKGLGKLLLNEDAIAADLEKNWAVVAEGIQTILRRENYPNPYETLKELTRTNQKINEKTIADFIETLNVDEKVKAELRAIKPNTYTGIYK